MPDASPPLASTSALAAAHARFARTSIAVYSGTVAVVLGFLVAALLTDHRHEQEQAEERLLLAAVERGQSLAQLVDLLVGELKRLGKREELKPGDADSVSEQALLELTHGKSAIFDVGVAVLDARGVVEWEEPRGFVNQTSFGGEPWFKQVKSTGETSLVAVDPERVSDALLYVVSPVLRNESFAGALVGAIDLSGQRYHTARAEIAAARTLVATLDGTVIFPPRQPRFAEEEVYRQLFDAKQAQARTQRVVLQGRPRVIATSPVAGTQLQLVLVAEELELLRPARERLYSSLAIGLTLLAAPLALLVLLQRRSLRLYREAEEAALREEQLQRLGEAANLIAHEVRNGLNGVSVGLDLVAGVQGRSEGERLAVLALLRREMKNLADFTGELMLVSKGIVPKPVSLDLVELLPELTAVAREAGTELGIEVEMCLPPAPLRVRVDPTLLRVVLTNLVNNAIEAVASRGDGSPGHVRLTLWREGERTLIRVQDDGPGVEPRVRLFEPFQTGKPSGTGIGLAVSRKIVRAHGGELHLEPTQEGASFRVELPSEGP